MMMLLISCRITKYELEGGGYETIAENKRIKHFVWEHLNNVNRVVQCIKYARGTFSETKSMLCTEITVVEIRNQKIWSNHEETAAIYLELKNSWKLLAPSGCSSKTMSRSQSLLIGLQGWCGFCLREKIEGGCHLSSRHFLDECWIWDLLRK